jgi:uncharacterized protein (TIGR02145 family)
MNTRIILFAMLLMISLMLNAQTIMNIHQSNGTVLQIPTNTIDSITYTITNPGNLATITTLPIGNITSTSATSGGNITNNGGTNVTQRGVVWSTSPNPTTANSQSSDGSGTGNYTSNLTGLTTNTTYYLRAYATNSWGTAYGNQLSFTTTSGGSGIVSIPGAGVSFDGYNYSSIVLGNGQEWMVENLRTTVYANGDPIPNVTDGIQWSNLTTGAWAFYNNYGQQYENPYGKLYNWYTVTDPRNVCPPSWHVPTSVEWSVLTDYLGGLSVAGNKMKSTGTQYWCSYNQYYATNESGFSGLPGGQRYTNGSCGAVGSSGYWWSSTMVNTSEAWSLSLVCSFSSDANEVFLLKEQGNSVRCLKD